MNYRNLQSTVRKYRNDGFVKKTQKLNVKKSILEEVLKEAKMKKQLKNAQPKRVSVDLEMPTKHIVPEQKVIPDLKPRLRMPAKHNVPKQKDIGQIVNEFETAKAARFEPIREDLPEIPNYKTLRKTVIQPGATMFSFKVKGDCTTTTGHSYPCDGTLTYTRNVRKPTSAIEIIEYVLGVWVEGNLPGNDRPNGSDVVVSYILDFKATPINKTNLNNVNMRNTSLAYKFLGDLTKIQKNKGECVLDYLVYKCSTTERFKHWTREKLINYFGKDCPKFGISTAKIGNWARDCGDVSVNAINGMNRVFFYIHPEKSRMSLTFIVNNEHCYPIMDKEYVRSICQNQRLDLEDFKFNLKFDTCEYVKADELADSKIFMNSKFKDLCKGTLGDSKVILIDSNSLSDLITGVCKETNLMVYNMKMDNYKVLAFEHPESKQVYVSAPEYTIRQNICKVLFDKYKVDAFHFVNQTYLELSKLYFEYVCKKQLIDGEYGFDYKSVLEFSPKAAFVGKDKSIDTGLYTYASKEERMSSYKEIMKKYKGKEEIELTDDCIDINEDQVRSFDITRDYTNILMTNTERWGVPSFYDELTEFDEDMELVTGEYYIKKIFKMGKMVCGNQFYTLPFVKYALENKYIQKSDIPMYIPFQRYLPADYFKDFAKNITEQFPKESKLMVNHLTGYFGARSYKHAQGMLTDSYETAMGILFEETEKGKQVKIEECNNMYLIRSISNDERSTGHMALYRQIIDMSYIKLDQMQKYVCDENSFIVSYTVDSVKVIRPCEDAVNKICSVDDSDKKPGDITIEQKCLIRGRTFDEIEEEIRGRGEFTFEEKQPKYIYEKDIGYDKVVEFVKNNSCFVIGVGGCGKTEMAKRVYDKDKDVVMTTTLKNVDNLRDRGVESQTFASMFSEYQSEASILKKLKSKNINVDEYSMAETKYMGFIGRLEKPNNDVKFRFYGDSNQLPAVEKNPIDYIYSTYALELADYNIVVLEYKGTRYDTKMYNGLDTLLKTGYLPTDWKDKKVDMTTWKNLCYTNECKKEGNQRLFERFVKEKNPEVFSIGIVQYAVGMPIMCCSGEKYNLKKQEIYNSQEYTITGHDNDNVLITDGKIEKKVPKDKFNHNFAHGFYSTVHRYQGGCIKEDYSIHEVEKFSLNMLYTALSRGVTYDKVHFDFNKKRFKRVKYTYKPYDCSNDIKLKTARIYKISGNGWFYIGMTTEELEKRLQQHRDHPVNKEMAKVINNSDVKIELLEEVEVKRMDEVMQLEKQYIEANKSDEMLNICHNTVKKVKKDIVIEIEIKKRMKNCYISERKDRIVLHYPNEDNKMQTKKYRFSDDATKAVAKAKAKFDMEDILGKRQ